MQARVGALVVVAVIVLLVALVPSRLMPSNPGGTPVPSASDAGGDGALAEWWVDPQALPIPPGATTIKAFLRERECASRKSPAGRIVGPEIEYRAEAVVVTFRVREIGGECPGNPAFPITVTLKEPLGNRALIDGRTGRDATIDPTPIWNAETATPPSSERAVDDAGAFAGGGLWAVRGTELFVSLDRGQSWRASTLPLRDGTFLGAWRVVVLDADHAWLVQNVTGTTTSADTDIINYTVSRTTDGGTTWTTADIPGNYPGTYPAIAFADPEHGYLIAAATRLSFGVTTVLRSSDGGATWAVAGTKHWLDRLVAVSDADTVWAGGSEQAGGLFDQSILSVSRDAGRTWEDLLLPGLRGTSEATCGCYLPGPPVFTSPTAGYVVVVNSFGNDANYGTWLETTSDGGRTWVEETFRPGVEASGVVELNADDWLMARENPSGIDFSSDAGKTWRPAADGGAFGGTAPIWIGGLGGDTVAELIQGSGTVLHLLVSTDRGATWTDAGPP